MGQWLRFGPRRPTPSIATRQALGRASESEETCLISSYIPTVELAYLPVPLGIVSVTTLSSGAPSTGPDAESM
jgi:hypothetical protein